MNYGSHSEEELQRIFDSSSGKCHLCLKPVKFEAYGQPSREGGWEVDHSRPRAEGGSDHGNNLYPAHSSCNRRRGTRSAREVRAEHGYSRPPRSAEERKRFKQDRAVGGFTVGALAAAGLGLSPIGIFGGALLLADVGHGLDPDEVEAATRQGGAP